MTALHATRHDWDYCHNPIHDDVEGDCPTCRGYLLACIDCDTQTTSGSNHRRTAVPEDGAPGGKVEHSPAPTRPAAPDHITWDSPLEAEVEFDADDTQYVNVHLTEQGARQLARDLTRRHMADLVLLAHLTKKGRSLVPHMDDARTVENRLAGALQAMATTNWTLTVAQAEDLTDQLEDATSDPIPCAVSTCTAPATAGAYCGPHESAV